ncbi:MAG: hypothetical protein A7315_15095 [Candidatus Altiarchaeales archaeon WOR_SM1_79]|nr:MAG: hypothetical protein A7315_15095 [Candidatus Altiarchaeales archaeon WOR_SM1_79]
MRAIGIDPGTRTWDFVCLEDGNLILDETVPTGKVKKEPELVINLIKEFNPDLRIWLMPRPVMACRLKESGI